MAQVDTNSTTLRHFVEPTVGGAPGASTVWRQHEHNTITSFGAQITKKSRTPISLRRGRRKGATVDKDSGVEYESDLSIDEFTDFAEGLVFSQFANKEFDLKATSGGILVPPPAVDGGGGNDSYTINSASATLAGKIVWAAGGAQTLIFAKGYTNAANNGLKVIVADVVSTDTSVQVATGTLVAETPPTSASLQVAGVRTDDLTLTISGSTATLVSAGDIANWATLGLRAGMYIHIGSATAAGLPQNAYSSNTVYGFARIVSISGSTLNLDKLDSHLTGGPHGPATIDVMFGRFVRNVPVGSASTDLEYLERTYQFEAAYPDLGGVGTPQYEYAIGNYVDTMALALAGQDFGKVTWGFIGTNSDPITSSRKTNASTAVEPSRTVAFNTSSNIASLTTDLISSVSDVCFKDLTITFKNNVSAEKCLGTLGASFINAGLFQVDIEGQMMFTSKNIVDAIRDNTTITFAAILANDDGAIAMDLPAMTFGDGGREFPLHQSVLVNITGETHTDPTLGHDVGITVFPSVPWVRS